jgi:S1-C subfamily serine protease
MRRVTVVGSLLVLAMVRLDAQMLDTQTLIYMSDRVLAGSIYSAAGSAIPPVVVLDRTSAGPPSAVPESSGVEIGATVRNLRPDELAMPGRRVVVESVAKDGPAFRAGIKTGDLLSFYAWGPEVDDTSAFTRRVRETPPGRALPVVVVRGDLRLMVSLIPQPAPARSPERP